MPPRSNGCIEAEPTVERIGSMGLQETMAGDPMG